MGQRHQIYIRIPNPVKYKNVPSYNKEGMKKLRQLFGNGKNTILALHHQWQIKEWHCKSLTLLLQNQTQSTTRQKLK